MAQGYKSWGDLRLRYEGLDQHRDVSNDRNRFRYRLRVGMEKALSDELSVAFRLASGDVGAITSTNESFDSNFAFKNIIIESVYATYKPEWANVGPFQNVEITAGKVKNPFTEGSSWMVWDSDVTPEGVYQRADLELFSSDALDAKWKNLAGQFILEEGSGSDNDDAELYAFQTGFELNFKELAEKPVKFKSLMSYYNFTEFALAGNFQSAGNNFTGVVPVPTNTLSAGAFNLVEFYNEIRMDLPGVGSSKLFMDWVTNVGEGAQLGRGQGANAAWALGVKFGEAKKKGTWELGYTYANIEANAVPSVFSDSDFGGSDRRGSVIKGSYALTDSMKLGIATFFTNAVEGGGLRQDNDQRLLQVDLALKF